MAAGSNRSGTIIGIAVLAVAIAALVWWWLSNSAEYIWFERYLYDQKEPYDAYIMSDLLQQSLGSEKFVTITDTIYRKVDLEKVPENSNYIFIGEELYLDSTECKFLLDFVKQGNKAFVFASLNSKRLLDSLLAIPSAYEYYWDDENEVYHEEFNPFNVYSDSLIEVNYSRPELQLDTAVKCTYIFDFKPQPNNWRYFKDSLYTREFAYVEELGRFNDMYVNYIRVPYGEGNFFMNSTPLIFSNYHMLNEGAMEYSRRALAMMGDGKTYWDEVNRYYDPFDFNGNYKNDNVQQGPLTFILSEPGLRNAWYLLLAASVLYLIFGAKRKQRIIPVNERLDNTSIEYAEVIAQLFMKEKDHKKLVLLKMDLFRAFLRERYLVRLPLKSADESDSFYRGIATKTNVPFELVERIFTQYNYLAAIEGVSTDVMLQFYNHVEEFYQRCK